MTVYTSLDQVKHNLLPRHYHEERRMAMTPAEWGRECAQQATRRISKKLAKVPA